MSGINLVIDHRETQVSLHAKALRLVRPNSESISVPLSSLDTVVVIGRPLVSCDVWHAFTQAGVAVTLLPARGTGTASWLGAGFVTGLARRRSQYTVFGDTAQRLVVVKDIISQKLYAKRRTVTRLLDRLEVWHVDDDTKTRALRALDGAQQQLQDAEAIDEVRGIEGLASRRWFALLREGIDPSWQFNTRNRRPPRDPVNALLSLTYTIMTSLCQRAVHSAGLDPQLGLLHDVRAGRPAMALDVIEPMRPACDVFVLSLLQDVLRPDDFRTSEGEGCRLGSHGRRVYFQHWTQQLGAWPDLLSKTGPDGTCDLTTPDIQREASACCRLIVERIVRHLQRIAPDDKFKEVMAENNP